MLTKPYRPRRHCVRAVKSGYPHGKRRWLRRRCGYQFTSLSRPVGADDRTRKTDVTLYGHGLSLRCVGKLLATSAHSVIRWVTGYVETFRPTPTPEGAVVIEVDGMWRYSRRR
jgi:transposase-like protein